MMSRNKKKPTAIDLFSGCGGMTLGLKRAGFEVLGAIDIDQLSVETFSANHQEVRVWQQDIRLAEPTAIAQELGLSKGDLSLLAGCPPCQGFSALRTRNGAVQIDDPRNELLLDFQRFAAAFLPKAIMMENVPRLASDKRFTHFCASMENLGYQGEFRVLDAADYGVPQRRLRLIYLAGYRTGISFARKRTAKVTVKQALARLGVAGRSGDPVHDLPERRSRSVVRLIRRVPKDGGSRADLPNDFQLACHKRCNGFWDVYGRMSWDRVAPTITSGCSNPSKGRFLHPAEDRAITMREAALLQGFPRTYKFAVRGGKEALARMIGNALPPPFVTAHSRGIRRGLHP